MTTTPYGLLSTGFAIKPLSQIIADMQAAQLKGISPSMNLQPPDPVAVLTGIVSAEVYNVWQLGGGLYSGMDPDQATGDALAGLALLSGTEREKAVATLVPGCTVNVNPGFSALAGTMFAKVPANPSVLFTNVEDVSSPGGGNVTVDFVCTSTGANPVNAGTLTGIASPLSGWNTITNPDDGVTGSAIQGDPGLRATRQAQLSASGSANAAALRALILRLLQPTTSLAPLTLPNIEASGTQNPFTITAATLSCSVLWNDTDSVDANGLPSHSLEVIAYAPGATSEDDTALCALILAYKAAGIGASSNGGTTVTKSITDDQGTSETIVATRPAPLTVTIALTVKTTDPSQVTVAQIKTALTNYVVGNSATGQLPGWAPGQRIYFNAMLGVLVDSRYGVADVLAVTAMTLNGAGADITPSARQAPSLAFGAITIT